MRRWAVSGKWRAGMDQRVALAIGLAAALGIVVLRVALGII